MSNKHELVGVISETSPGSASTVVSTATVSNLARFDRISIEADLVGATGGTLDVYIQRKLATDLWRDWAHFTQLAAGGAAVKWSIQDGVGTSIVAVGGGTDATPGVALAANTFVGGHPGEEIRLVFVAGASTTLGATQTVRVFGLRS